MFDKVFKWELPSGADWETKTIRKIREWIFTSGLSSETAFEQLLNSVGRITQKTLSRSDFHKAMGHCLRMPAQDLDSLFMLLDYNNDGELDILEWKTRIYEDSTNPL